MKKHKCKCLKNICDCKTVIKTKDFEFHWYRALTKEELHQIIDNPYQMFERLKNDNRNKRV